MDNYSNLTLIYSPDDGGYYWEDQNPTENAWRVSVIYKTESEAESARRSGSIRWEVTQ